MKTVGQILKASREERSLSVDQLSSLTKIDAKYIVALEEDAYDKLPSETFAKGFIRNLSLRLDKNPNEMVAIFRRDFRPLGEKDKTAKSHHRFSFSLFSHQAAFFVLAIAVFFIYLGFQFRAVLSSPNLTIGRPTPNSVLISPIDIEGVTTVDSVITINEDTRAKPDTSGHFLVRYTLPVGETTLEIKATNRFGRSSLTKIPVTIVSQ
jgi:cytoskeletal protein RodZ